MTGENWPVYKGESFDLWEPDKGIYFGTTDPDTITEHLQTKRNSARSVFAEFPSDYLNNISTLHCFKCRIAFRNITRSTDKRTIVAALLPPGVVAANHAPVLFWPFDMISIEREEAFLLGLLCSMVLDWYARRFVELNLNFYILNNFPIPEANLSPDEGDPAALRIIEISGRLAAVDERYKEWADEVGVPVGSVNDPEDKEQLVHELDACVAHLYGLDEDDLACLYETFHKPGDYDDRHAAVLELFRNQPWLDQS